MKCPVRVLDRQAALAALQSPAPAAAPAAERREVHVTPSLQSPDPAAEWRESPAAPFRSDPEAAWPNSGTS